MTTDTNQQNEVIANLLAQGNKIGAIKAYREATGKGLKESKDFVEALIPQLMAKDPEKYAKAASGGKGCGAAMFLFAGAVAALVVALAMIRN